MPNSVEPMDQDAFVLDDAELQPEDNAGDSLDSIITEDEQPAEPIQQPQQKNQSEPGWMRSKMEAYARKEVAKAREEIRQEYEQQFAPYRARLLERDAEDLVAQGEFKSKERALEYVYMKNGMAVPEGGFTQATSTQPRDASGRFTAAASKQDDIPADVRARANELQAQARAIKAASGLDVMEIYNSDPAVKEKVLSGEWDFADVAENAGRGRRTPSTMRASNGGAVVGSATPAGMTDEQFDRLDANLADGRVYNLRNK